MTKPSDLSPTFLARMNALFDRPEGECWMWQGRIDRDGYGDMAVGPRHAGRVMAHRAVYMEMVGPIPDGMVIDHLCGARACVNPSHLEPVTPAENTHRAPCASTLNSQKTRCPKGHPYYQGKRQRYCRECRREWNRNYYQRKRANASA